MASYVMAVVKKLSSPHSSQASSPPPPETCSDQDSQTSPRDPEPMPECEALCYQLGPPPGGFQAPGAMDTDPGNRGVKGDQRTTGYEIVEWNPRSCAANSPSSAYTVAEQRERFSSFAGERHRPQYYKDISVHQ